MDNGLDKQYRYNVKDTHPYPGIDRKGIFVAIANNTFYGSKLSIFLFSKDHVT